MHRDRICVPNNKAKQQLTGSRPNECYIEYLNKLKIECKFYDRICVENKIAWKYVEPKMCAHELVIVLSVAINIEY